MTALVAAAAVAILLRPARTADAPQETVAAAPERVTATTLASCAAKQTTDSDSDSSATSPKEKIMTILITGARGSVGGSVLRGLLKAGVPASELRASGRDPRQLSVPAGVTAVAADLGDRDSLRAAFDGADQAFLLAPERVGMAPLAAALREAGLEHVVVLSAAAIDEPNGGALAAMHRAIEDAIGSAGVPMTALRPGAFASNALEWAAEIRADGTVSVPYPGSHTVPIHPADIADAAVAVLTGQAERGKPVPLTGPQSLSFRDHVEILARELDRDLRLIELTPEQTRARMSGAPAPVVDTLLAIWAASDGTPRPVHDVQRITGRPARTFAQWVREHRAAFTG